MSSRNAYLSADQRQAAAALPRTLNAASLAIASGADARGMLTAARNELLSAGFDSIDYLELRDGATLAELAAIEPGARLFVAARIGSTRLIDNLEAGAQIPGAGQG
jgi:pantoate--beta-alanine ligase